MLGTVGDNNYVGKYLLCRQQYFVFSNVLCAYATKNGCFVSTTFSRFCPFLILSFTRKSSGIFCRNHFDKVKCIILSCKGLGS